MSPRTYWNQYVQKNGGAVSVATKLGIPYPTIACICNGSRGIRRATAQRMVNADSSLDKSILIWVTPAETKISKFNQNSDNTVCWPELAENEALAPSLPSSSLSGQLAGVQAYVGVPG